LVEQAKPSVFASGVNYPFGIAFYPPGPDPQWVYIGDTDAVLRFPCRNGDLTRLAALGPQHADSPSAAFRDEYVAVGRSAQRTRTGETRCEQVHFEAGRNDRLLVTPMRHSDEIVGRGQLGGRRQVSRFDQPACSRLVGAPVAERRLAFGQGAAGLRKKRQIG